MAEIMFDDGQVQLWHGHVIDALKRLPDESVQAVITSPPYWSLRAYGTEAQVWGGDAECAHEWGAVRTIEREMFQESRGPVAGRSAAHTVIHTASISDAHCPCGAWRGELGHEPTPQMFVAHLVDIFREVRRVMKPDAVLFVNLGDSYSSQGGSKSPGQYHHNTSQGQNKQGAGQSARHGIDGIRAKSLVLIPERFAIAMAAPYHVGPIKNETDRAWLAGIVDADGAIGISAQTNNVKRGWNKSYTPRIAVAQSDTQALERIVQITGVGSVRVKDRPSTDSRGINSTKTFYEWRIDGQKAATIIREIYPWLFIKRAQAQAAWTMGKLLSESRPGRQGKVPEKDMEHRHALFEYTKLLNQRAPVDPPLLFDVPPADEPGWIVRSRICWAKKAPMPESVTDRPTSAWEHIFMFTRSPRYYWDQEAVREPSTEESLLRHTGIPEAPNGAAYSRGVQGDKSHQGNLNVNGIWGKGRNLWNYWVLSPDPEPMAHFATFPREIPRRCIAAATSEKGECPKCGKSWVRVVERSTRFEGGSGRAGNQPSGKHAGAEQSESGSYDIRMGPVVETTTTGWAPQCDHDLPPVPSTVLDPFCGSGTTNQVARSMLRRSIGIDLSETYLRDIALKKNAQMALIAELEVPA